MKNKAKRKVGRPATTLPIAKKAGVTTAAVRQKRAQGKSDDQIIAEGLAKRAKREVWSREEFQSLEMKKLRAEAELKELEAQKRRGELIDVAEAGKAWTRVAEILRDAFTALPARAALKVAGKNAREVQVILQNEVHAILSQVPEQITAVEVAA